MQVVRPARSGTSKEGRKPVFDWYVWSTLEMRDRYDERLREIEQIRLAHELSLVQPRERLTDRALVTLGRRLVEWGRQLEARYAVPVAPASTAQSTAHGSPLTEVAPARRPGPMVALDAPGAAHKHMNLYSHSHRG